MSACKTAAGGVANTDEAITLAAALQYSGWRHVIATLWTVRDDTAVKIAGDVYPRLVDRGRLDPAGSAEALHHAIRRQRTLDRRRPSEWAPFVHIGP